MKEKNRNMVAISLYRGNLHRTPDVPRRWLMPNPKISLKDFKSLLARRSKALSRSQPNPNPNPNLLSTTTTTTTTNHKLLQLSNQPPELVDSNKPLHGSDFEIDAFDKPSDAAATSIDKHTHPVIANVDLHHDKDKRKKEVEDKLQVLNAKKHSLVLVLKQILNAEEDLKRRNSLQQQGVVTTRGPSVPPKADGTNDTGSVTKYLALRLGSEGNLGDLDGVEADDFTNHNNQHSQLVLRTSSMSPSSESPLRRTPSVQQNLIEPCSTSMSPGQSGKEYPNYVSNPARASFTSAGSPSCFAHSGQQGNPPNLPSASVSGTSYIASSPSPAASGGTSVYRDAQHPSPWK